MVTLEELQTQFRRLDYKPTFWAREEVKELPHILVPGEQITNVVSGWYEGGIALLMTTNYRVLMVDKKTFFLTVEDLRYNKISDVKYQYRLMDANVSLSYPGKSLEFKSWSKDRLRQLVYYIQESIMLQRQADQVITDNSRNPVSEFPLAPQPLTAYAQPILQQQQAATQPSIPMTATNIATHAYKTGQQFLRGHKLSRFITMSQINR